MHKGTRGILRSSDGVSLIEIVVSMFILALIAVAFLPLLIQGIKQSAANATRAAAVRIVSDEIDRARSVPITPPATVGPRCADVRAKVDVPVPVTNDSRGNSLTTTKSAGTCSAVVGSYPTTLTFTVEVSRTGGASLAKASTLIYVGAP
jgi:Tfp pilus assembly protein PilV